MESVDFMAFFYVRSMGEFLWVQVPLEVDCNERSKTQQQKGDRLWGRSVE